MRWPRPAAHQDGILDATSVALIIPLFRIGRFALIFIVEDTQNKIQVGITGDLVFIKVEGKGTFQISQPLRQFSLEIVGRGYREFVVDLSGCPTMYSTFLGVLAGMGLRLQNLAPAKPSATPSAGPGKIHLANLNSRCLEVLCSLGIDKLFTIDLCELRIGAPTESAPVLQPLPQVTAAPSDNARMRQAEVMLEAHHTLMEVAPQNVPKFKDVTRFLA